MKLHMVPSSTDDFRLVAMGMGAGSQRPSVFRTARCLRDVTASGLNGRGAVAQRLILSNDVYGTVEVWGRSRTDGKRSRLKIKSALISSCPLEIQSSYRELRDPVLALRRRMPPRLSKIVMTLANLFKEAAQIKTLFRSVLGQGVEAIADQSILNLWSNLIQKVSRSPDLAKSFLDSIKDLNPSLDQTEEYRSIIEPFFIDAGQDSFNEAGESAQPFPSEDAWKAVSSKNFPERLALLLDHIGSQESTGESIAESGESIACLEATALTYALSTDILILEALNGIDELESAFLKSNAQIAGASRSHFLSQLEQFINDLTGAVTPTIEHAHFAKAQEANAIEMLRSALAKKLINKSQYQPSVKGLCDSLKEAKKALKTPEPLKKKLDQVMETLGGCIPPLKRALRENIESRLDNWATETREYFCGFPRADFPKVVSNIYKVGRNRPAPPFWTTK